jgi:DMSO/TMAO reductase YedYZ molybdopterin-dependent catalytic subunit
MDEPPISRGFRSRRQADGDNDRVPPGQHITRDFPVLSAGPTPRANLADWSFSLDEDGRELASWSWPSFAELPQTKKTVDIHCVTSWSKLGTDWRGVTIDDLFAAAGIDDPPTPYVMAHSYGGYTTNLPVEDLLDGKAMIATEYDGLPLAPAHGGPARLLVPHLYFWKSAKWVRSLEFIPADEPGFWESAGYHIYGDPWREQRYAGD